jgi:hypothetical protein
VCRDLEGGVKGERPPESPRLWRKFNISGDLKETSVMTFTGFVSLRIRRSDGML